MLARQKVVENRNVIDSKNVLAIEGKLHSSEKRKRLCARSTRLEENDRSNRALVFYTIERVKLDANSISILTFRKSVSTNNGRDSITRTN